MAERKTSFDISSMTDEEKLKHGIPVPGTGPGIVQLATAGVKKVGKKLEQGRAFDVITDSNDPTKYILRNPDLAASRIATERANPANRTATGAGAGASAAAPSLTEAQALRQTQANAFLETAGVNAAAQGQDPSRFNNNPDLRASLLSGKNKTVDTQAYRTPEALRGASAAIPGGRYQQAAREVLTNTDQVNLGSFGVAGGPNIYGKASKPGGRIDTFTGAGVPGVNVAEGDTSVVSPDAVNRVGATGLSLRGQGQQVTTGADGQPQVYNPTGYDNANPYGGAQAQAALGASARAGTLRAANPAFSGGVAGSSGAREREVRNINSQANRAFNDALKQGMNTKAAQRISESIRASAGTLNDVEARRIDSEFNAIRKYGIDEETATRRMEADLRQQGALAQLEADQAQLGYDQDYEVFQSSFLDDPEVPGSGAARAAEVYQAIGGREVFRSLNGTQQNKVRKMGERIVDRLNGLNEYMKEKGEGVVYDNYADVYSGASIKLNKDGQARFGVDEITIGDVLAQGTADITDLTDKGVTLGDGRIVPMSVWKDFGPQTNDEREATLLLVPRKGN